MEASGSSIAVDFLSDYAAAVKHVQLSTYIGAVETETSIVYQTVRQGSKHLTNYHINSKPVWDCQQSQ
jgi:hypothetical protein